MPKERSVVGDLINFRGLVYSPVNEQGVVYLFSNVAEDINRARPIWPPLWPLPPASKAVKCASSLLPASLPSRWKGGRPESWSAFISNYSALDELSYVPFSKAGAELLFEMVSRAYERTSLIITTNLSFEAWVEVMGSERLTGALLDRLTYRVRILEANAPSYRLREAKRRLRKQTSSRRKKS